MVKFFRRSDAVVSSTDQTNMSQDTDGIYLTSYNNNSYLFYRGSSLSSSPTDRNPFYAEADTGSNAYTFTPYKELSLSYGTQILVQFNHDSIYGTPTLNGTPIVRRLSNADGPTSGATGWLKTDTSYVLTYTKIGVNNFWIVEGQNKPTWSDLYGIPLNSPWISTSTSDTTTPTTLESGKLYIIYDN